ncbi:mannose-1-phosphate guanylyltransferase [Rhizobium sp. CRIBSB]|nr:mannose-1-phosphate guanylyltransferase [Rhizobium sp. CRIBSB]
MLYPVIMCGGAGTRLWPASRPARPKQFLALSGPRSLFQDTVLRVAPLTGGGGDIIIVGGVAHGDWIEDQLAQIGVEATVLLEPAARDSAAAMAAAAAWTHRTAPEGVNVFVASDHHIPDAEAFRRAVTTAAVDARQGRIVTLGVRPTEPSSAYGYIQPAAGGASPDTLAAVQAFVEKPDATTAVRYIEAGYLWNSGNFIARAETLLSELDQHAPAVAASARAALPDAGGRGTQTLTPAFLDAPRISIDYAVMEKTRRASVLPVAFGWSDLGAWDAIRATGSGDVGLQVMEDSEGCLIRTHGDVLVATLGVRNLAIIVEPDAVLVCDIDRAQEVKTLVERIRGRSPGHLDFTAGAREPLEAAATRFLDWMRLRALPLWSTLGQSRTGAFAESLTLDGRPLAGPRRVRVQARQIHVHARAGLDGWQGDWAGPVRRGLDCLLTDYRRPDGLFRTLLAADMSPLDETAVMFDQAFVLLALASATQAGIGDPALIATADDIRDRMTARFTAAGTLVETAGHPYQAGPHMHLLEAALAWEDASGSAGWRALSDHLGALALNTFIDASDGAICDTFDAAWTPLGDQARASPGHQFEWAWLIARLGMARGDETLMAAARALYANGMKGFSRSRGVIGDAIEGAGTASGAEPVPQARLWPQTEWLKAALILGQTATGSEQEALSSQAASALRAVQAYLTPDGLWRDKMAADGTFIDEPAPASTLYHLCGAATQFGASARNRDFSPIPGLPLS